ncbi:MAG: hypothetical protein QOH39_243 [Verrucomicrobiota bacterium]|jgi:hypothetical protein
MRKILTTLALVCAGFAAHVPNCRAGQNDGKNPPAAAAAAVNPVLQWNRILLEIVRTPGAQSATVHPTHSFALMHTAIYDAANAIERTNEPYLVRLDGVPRHTSEDAAAATAAHDVLVALYPAFQSALDTDEQQSLTQIPAGKDKDRGLIVGRTVANRILSLRSNDGANAQPIPYVFGSAPGDYQSTPPNFPPQPQFTHWSDVTPFTLNHANQFRPGPPPGLTSGTYSLDFNEIKSLGIANSTTATADQALTGRFWNGAIQNYWNEIAQTAALGHNLTTGQSARLFALLNLALADGVIAFYDAKYTYNLWRPVTAIRSADSDGNPQTTADPNWLPQAGKTAPDPSYPGAHAVISAAGAEVLIFFFGPDGFEFNVTSEVLPGVERSFTSLSAAAEEATLSRIFAGQHFRLDLTAGQQLGREVADFVTDNFLTSLHRQEDTNKGN